MKELFFAKELNVRYQENKEKKNDDRISTLGHLEDGGSINQGARINMMRSFSQRIFHFCETGFPTIMQLMGF